MMWVHAGFQHLKAIYQTDQVNPHDVVTQNPIEQKPPNQIFWWKSINFKQI